MKFKSSLYFCSEESHGEEIAHTSSCMKVPEESRAKLSAIIGIVKPASQLQKENQEIWWSVL